VSALVTWEPRPLAGLLGYRVERRMDGGAWEPAHGGELLCSAHQDLVPASCGAVAYRVAIVDASGVVGPWSPETLSAPG
jgi:hypothetical protein